MADAEAQRDWIARVLDFSIGPEHERPTGTAPVLPLWVAAKEEVDAGIERLQHALREDGDEDLRAIAEFGLNGATNRQSVGLMAALREADASPSPETRARAADAAGAFRDFLESAPIVSVIEKNPFGVAIPMRATLGQALGQIQRALAA